MYAIRSYYVKHELLNLTTTTMKNRITRLSFQFFITVYLFISAYHVSAQDSRHTYNFNPGWKLYVGDVQGAENRNNFV